KVVRKFIKIYSSQQVNKTFSSHFCNELVRIIVFQVLIFLRKGVKNIQIFLLCKEVHLFKLLTFQAFCNTCLNNHIPFIVYDHIKFLGWQSKKVTYFVR